MVSSSLNPLFVSRPAIRSFERSAPDIVGVGASEAEFSKFINVPFKKVEDEVAHALLVISNWQILFLIGTDILRRNNAILLF